MNTQDKSVANARKVQVQMIQTEKAVEMKNKPGGIQRFNRLLESANKHAMDVIPKATDKTVWCAITAEADLIMVHFNHKDTAKIYAYLYSYDEFYTQEDGNFKGYNLIEHCFTDYDESDTMISSRALIDD